MWQTAEFVPARWILDQAPASLPDDAVTSLQNVDFFAGTARALSAFASYATPPETPYAMQYYENATLRRLATFGATNMYEYDGASFTSIKPATGLTGSLYWDTDAFGEWCIVTNDIPGQAPHAINVAGSVLAPLPGWIAGAECFVLRTHRNHIFAANLIEGANNYPNRVRWSTSAITGALPSTWTPQPSNDAGVIDLEIPGGEITDMAAIGDSLFIGGPGGVWIARYVGGAYVYAFSQRSKVNGPRKHRCMASLGDVVAILTRDDLVLMDEQSERSLMVAVNSSLIKTMIDAALVYVEPTRVLYLLYGTNGSGYTNALIWDRDTDTWGSRDLGAVYNSSAKALQVIVKPAKIWSDFSATPWTWWAGAWRPASFDTPVYFLGKSGSIDSAGGASWNWMIERDNMPAPEGEYIRVRSLELEIDGNIGQEINVRLGSSEYPGGSITWGRTGTYTLGSEPIRHDDIVKGRYLSYRAEGNGNARIANARLYYRVNGLRP